MNSRRRGELSKVMKRSTSFVRVRSDEYAGRMSDSRIDSSTYSLNSPPEMHTDLSLPYPRPLSKLATLPLIAWDRKEANWNPRFVTASFPPIPSSPIKRGLPLR